MARYLIHINDDLNYYYLFNNFNDAKKCYIEQVKMYIEAEYIDYDFYLGELYIDNDNINTIKDVNDNLLKNGYCCGCEIVFLLDNYKIICTRFDVGQNQSREP